MQVNQRETIMDGKANLLKLVLLSIVLFEGNAMIHLL